MNFSSNIQIVKGGEIPNNSVALIYSPNCGYCHQMIPEFNSLPDVLRAGGLSDTQVVAVDIQQEFHSLRAGGLQVMGVPHVIIKTVQGGYIQYTGPRMADNIAQEAARVLNGGETQNLNGGASPDALLGGSTPVVAPTTDATASLEGGRKRRRHHKSKSKSRKSRKSRSRKHRKHMKGGEIEGGETQVVGTETTTTTTEPTVTGGAVTTVDLEGGRKRRRHSKSKSKSRKSRSHRKHRKHMKGGETEGLEIEGGDAELEGGRKRRRSKSKSKSRKSRSHRKHRKHMKGGEVEGLEIEGGENEIGDLEGGKKNPRSRSRTLWLRTIRKLYKTGKYKNWASAMKSAAKIYRKKVIC